MSLERPITFEDSLKTITAYKYALDQADIVAITDPKGIIGYVNDNFCKISGYNKAELIGNDHRIINSEYHPKEFFNALWQTIAAGKVWKGEIRNKTRNGTYYWVDTTIVPFLNDDGKPYQYLAIRHDITERKLAEERIKAANTELESFSYMVAHDLKAPLRIIKSLAGILLKEPVQDMNDEAAGMLDLIAQNALRMSQLIDDLLRFSRLGAAPVEPLNCDMKNIVYEIINVLKESGIDPRAEIIVTDLQCAKCDPNLIRQVWINLISNALKYSAHATLPVIEIGAYHSGANEVYFIKDNGVGFNMKHADRLFKVFQRLHSDSDFKGTGIGLALAYKIIKKHGGDMWAKSEEGKGAVFYFSLPVQ